MSLHLYFFIAFSSCVAAQLLRKGKNSMCQLGRKETMLDIVLIAVTVAFFGIAWAYTLGCDRL